MSEDETLLKELKKLPWEDRLLHTNWKVRYDANIDLAALCYSITDPKDHRFGEFGPFFKKTIADSNATVQDKALDALIAFLRASDADAARYAEETCDAIVAKCITGRPESVEKSQTVLMLWVELEAVDVVLDAMEKAIKVAKAVVPAVDVMFQALSEFGSKIVPPRRILKMLPELVDLQDQNVRASSKGLALELCRWIGKDPVKSILLERRQDTMTKELEAELVDDTGTAGPSRKIRAEQDKEREQEAEFEVVGSVPSEESAADETFESARTISTWPTSKSVSEFGESSSNRVPRVSNWLRCLLSFEEMEVVFPDLALVTSDPESSTMDDAVKEADILVSCLANKVAKAFDFCLAGGSSRSCKNVLHMLMQILKNKRLAHAVKESTLDSLITELLLWLLDERVPRIDNGSQLLKTLNALMLKILENGERTSVFVVLINLLCPLDPSRWPSPASNVYYTRNQRFSDLVVKCLVQLTKSAEGMKAVCHELALLTSDPESSTTNDDVRDADRLVSCLVNKVAKPLDFSLTGASSRSCNFVLHTLMQLFQNKRLAHAVKESTLDSLITELLLWLLDERVPRIDNGSQLLKTLNALMVKILDNAERTSSFVVLINLLRPSRWPSPASNVSSTRNQKLSYFVVKRLVKLTKVLPSTIHDVNLGRILQSIHVYLQELGMEEIRRRARANDKPLCVVKIVLNELVKLRGTAIKRHLSMVPIDMEPQPIILAYIDLCLQTLAAARMLTPSGPVDQTRWGKGGEIVASC